MTKPYSTQLDERKVVPELVASSAVPRVEPDVWKFVNRMSLDFPDYLCQSAWLGHAPFAFWLVSKLRPHSFVELGVGRGFSYLTVCQVVSRLHLGTRCFGIDHWLGDEQAGYYTTDVFDILKAYHDERYLRFSTLVRSTFDDAAPAYEAGSIDLLHIDGFHSYEAVRHDFETWKPKLSGRGVVLFHDTNVREGDFGVYRLWGELSGAYPSFEFIHEHGLGVLGVGENLPTDLMLLFDASSDLASEIRDIYAHLGETIRDRWTVAQIKAEHSVSEKRIRQLEQQLHTQKPLLAAAVERATQAELIAVEFKNARDNAIEELNWTIAELASVTANREQLELRLKDTAAVQERQRSEMNNLANEVKAAKDEIGALIADYCTVRDRAAVLSMEVDRIRRSRVWRAVFGVNIIVERCGRWLRRRAQFLCYRRWEATRKAQREVPAVTIIAASKLFDRDWYLQRNPDVRASGMDPCYHYLQHGWKEGRNPGPFFDSKWYLERYPDVSNAGVNPLIHYLTYGLHEGRRSRFVVAPAPYDTKQMAPKNARGARPSRQFGVNFIGPVSIASGLGTASRGYLRALAAAQVPARVIPVVEGFEHQKQLYFDVGRPSLRPYKISLVQLNADATQIALKLAPGEFMKDRYRIGLWVWELAAFPPEWHDCIERYDEIWVPSKFCQRSVSALSRKPVNVMPYVVPVSETPLDLSIRQEWGLPQDAFVFLYMFDASSYLARKNPLFLIEAFIGEFAANPKVVLVLKVSYAQYAHREFEAVRRRCLGLPNIRLIEDVVEADQVLRFIDAADCYVSPHRSEGFGLTVAEALSRGKPVIATDYGGTKDFLTEETGYPIPYKLIEIESTMGPYQKGYVWANPDMDALRSRMRQVVSDPEAARKKGLQGSKYIRTMYNERALGERLRSRLDEIWLSHKSRGLLAGVRKALYPSRTAFTHNQA